MFYPHYDLVKRVAEMRVEDALHRAEVRRLLCEAGIDDRGWITRQGCWLLCQVGHGLVALGHRLEQYASASGLPAGSHERPTPLV